MRFYDVSQSNLEKLQLNLNENLVILFEYLNDNEIVIGGISNLDKENDLNFLLNCLNHTKGHLWEEIYHRTHFLIKESDFIPQKEFFVAVRSISNKEIISLYNYIQLKTLISNYQFVLDEIEMIVTRLFKQKNLEEIPEKFKIILREYISNNINKLKNIGTTKILDYQELVPSEYIIHRILEETSDSLSQKKKSFVLKYISKNPAIFRLVLQSRFPSEELYSELADQQKFEYLNHLGIEHFTKLDVENEYIRILKEDINKIGEVPDEYFELNTIMNLLPKIEQFIKAVKRKKSDRIIKGIFRSLNENERISVCSYLPKFILLEYPKYIRHLPDLLMREICFEIYNSKWEYIPADLKMKIILDTMKYDRDPNILITILYAGRETNHLIKVLLFILTFDKRSIEKHNFVAHVKINEEITNYLKSVINVQVLKISMKLLPTCQLGKTYFCEMKIVEKSDEDSYTFCPRTKSYCELGVTNAQMNIESDDWGFFEIFDKYGTKFELENLQNPNEYVNKLAGYVNRLIELDNKMVCRSCDERLISNQKYSKFLARYSMTVARCVNPTHDQVYFNHCWNCTEIIDSRDCPHQVGKYYLCMNCGAGVNDKLSHDYVEPGTECPNCRHNELQYVSDKFNRNSECLKCGYRILQKKL